MKTSTVFIRQPWPKVAAVSLVLLFAAQLDAQQGPNAVWSSSGAPSPSVAWIDASTFTLTVSGNTYTDICARIIAVLTSTNYPAGMVIDARGVLNGSDLVCPVSGPTGNPTTPWVYGNLTTNKPSTILLPDAVITIPTTWVLPNGTRLVGEQTTSAQAGYATLQAAPGFTPVQDGSNAMVEMGSAASGICPGGGPCYGISVEHLTLWGNSKTINGIYNGYAQDQSYVHDVDFWGFEGTGLYVDVPSGAASFGGATGSGPYSTLQFVPPQAALQPVCVQLNAQTRGIHGITCIGSDPTAPPSSCSSNGNSAAIYVTAGNNSLSDLHIESYCDGIQVAVGNTIASTSNVVISNLVTAQKGGKSGKICTLYPPVQNSVHICGPHPNSSFGQCSNTSGNISDVSVLQVSTTAGNQQVPITAIQDDITGTSISPPITGGSVGSYSLGEGLGNPAYGYSRFSTSPSPSGLTNSSTPVPTWGVGSNTAVEGATCTTPGTLYSNTQGATGSTIYVCTAGTPNTWKNIL